MQPPSQEQAAFWHWFEANGQRLRSSLMDTDEEVRERASDEMHAALSRAQAGIVFAFGGKTDSEDKEFVLSADGKRDQFDNVKSFVASAPYLPGWNIVAFRPRINLASSFAIRVETEELSPDDLWFSHDEENGLGLTLYIRGLSEDNRRLREVAAMIFLDHALGEHDAVTLVDAISSEVLPDDPAGQGLLPFLALPEFIDAYKAERYPPPGELPLEDEGNWTAMQGAINGKPATVLLNMDLQPYAGHPRYDRLLIVSIPFNEVNEDGMPETDEELGVVQQIGDLFGDVLQEGQQSLLAAIIVNDGRRDLIFYTSDAQGAATRAEEAQSEVSDHQAEILVQYDTFWDNYLSFVQAIEGEDDEEEEEESD